MFTDLFRIVSEHGLAVPPEIAAVFRALATMEGTLTALAPGFDIVAEAAGSPPASSPNSSPGRAAQDRDR
jgi:predicted unusual protein kinase regulating ubiquinone biosynthesis (AarF/ABC1/UbiB family)